LKFSEKPIPYDPFDKNDNKKRSKSQEKRIAHQTKGRVQPGSGAIPMKPGDIKAGNMEAPEQQSFLIEAKTTRARSHGVSEEKLIKITKEAVVLQKSPAYWITFESMPSPYEKDWIVLPASLLKWTK